MPRSFRYLGLFDLDLCCRKDFASIQINTYRPFIETSGPLRPVLVVFLTFNRFIRLEIDLYFSSDFATFLKCRFESRTCCIDERRFHFLKRCRFSLFVSVQYRADVNRKGPKILY